MPRSVSSWHGDKIIWLNFGVIYQENVLIYFLTFACRLSWWIFALICFWTFPACAFDKLCSVNNDSWVAPLIVFNPLKLNYNLLIIWIYRIKCLLIKFGFINNDSWAAAPDPIILVNALQFRKLPKLLTRTITGIVAKQCKVAVSLPNMISRCCHILKTKKTPMLEYIAFNFKCLSIKFSFINDDPWVSAPTPLFLWTLCSSVNYQSCWLAQ